MVFKNGEGDLFNILEPSTFVFFFKLHFMYLCEYVSECSEVVRRNQLSVLRRPVLLRHVYGGQRTIEGSQFSPPTLWVSGIKLRPSFIH